MTKAEEFLVDFRDTIGTAVAITLQTPLADIPEWDSLTSMSIVTLLATRYGVDVTLADLQQVKTVGDVMGKANIPE